ncbi:hypothetical protein P9112_011265 [Eukaryota sp. TZLM1-RC]
MNDLILTTIILASSFVLSLWILRRRTRNKGHVFQLIPQSLPLQYPDVPSHIEESIRKEVNQTRTTTPDFVETPAANFGAPYTYFENVHLPTAISSSLRFLESAVSKYSDSLKMGDGEPLPDYMFRIHSTIKPTIPLPLCKSYLDFMSIYHNNLDLTVEDADFREFLMTFSDLIGHIKVAVQLLSN